MPLMVPEQRSGTANADEGDWTVCQRTVEAIGERLVQARYRVVQEREARTREQQARERERLKLIGRERPRPVALGIQTTRAIDHRTELDLGECRLQPVVGNRAAEAV